MRVLVLNPGSSSLKGSIVEGGVSIGNLDVPWEPGAEDATGVVHGVLDRLTARADAVGYRVVHGGSVYRAPTLVDDALLGAVDELDDLAPLHNRRASAVMRAGGRALPDLPHIACFDTAFHATLPEEGWRYPLPGEWVEATGIRRFGFHGLSVAWATQRSAQLLGRGIESLRLVVAHLGSGCSVTAVDGGRSVDTSMGFTPYEGMMMATRSGSVDPGILLRLLDGIVTRDALADGLAERSGLRAIAGTSSAQEIEERAAAGDQTAQLALAMFARRAAAAIAAASTTLPSLDALVFTGGIGEHSATMRTDIARRLAGLGIAGTLAATDGDGIVADGPAAVLVVKAREDLVVAAEVVALLATG